jgi:tetratricopeptide (TPR) repeat protein
MAVTFPVVLLILDFFVYRKCFQIKGETTKRAGIDYIGALVEKLPFILLAAAACMVTIAAQDAGTAVAYLEAHSLSSRWNTATNAYLVYLKQSVMPVNLAAFYPVTTSSSASALLMPGALLGALLIFSLRVAPRYPLILAGLCWYLVTLLPVIGLVQVGSQAHADRYMYLPSVGLLMSCVYLLPSRDNKYFQIAAVLACVCMVYLSAICYWQIGYWKNQHTLFSRVQAVSGPTYLAHLHLTEDYIRRGMLQQAREQGMAALAIRPDLADGYQAIGNIALAEENFQEAEKYYRVALAKGPKMSIIHNNLGITLAEQGDTRGGIKAFERALEIQPDMQEAQQNLRHYNNKLQQKIGPVTAP